MSVPSAMRRERLITAQSTAVQAAPPPPEVVKVDSVTAHKVVSGVHLIRGNCASRLKYEVEYNLKRGTTDNSYILQAPGAAVLIDVPFEAFADEFGER